MYKNFKVINQILITVTLLWSISLNASDDTNNTFNPLYSLVNVNVNYLDWSKSTENKTTQEDFTYLEIEAIVGWTWGEFYGFIDIENPTKSYNDNAPSNLRFSAKAIFDIKLDENIYIHIQDYYLHSDTFCVNNLVTGVSYKYISDDGLWIKPFIGVHYQNSTFYSGLNGYMAGWILNYDMKFLGEKFSLFQSHEIEFNRNKEDYQLSNGTPIGNKSSHGINGRISLWWHANKKITTGIQYRYAEHKLGFEEYQSAFIYTFKYNL